MNDPARVDLWRKAAVLGSLWAASEIVFGSFMHNARIPMTGYILTGIGIAILVAGHRLWPLRGLLWRAGLICAAMKSVSPSAIILAPMVAISAEGFLAEAGVALGGATPAGYVLAGALAMSWPLAHKLGGALLFYGPETWAIYAKLLAQVRSWSGLAPGSPWTPLLVLWAAHVIGGITAAMAGILAGRGGQVAKPLAQLAEAPAAQSRKGMQARGERSVPALLLHVFCVVAFMSVGSKAGVPLFAAAAAVYAALSVWRYPCAARLMRRSSLWTGILGAALLAGLVLGRWQAGAQMGLRALVLTLGFACVGEELRNPVLRSWLERRGGRMFFAALEQAFETLPMVFEALPAGKELLRSPLASLRSAISSAPALLENLTQARVFLITGDQGEGKSTLVRALAGALRASGLSVGGIHAPGYWTDGRRAGFDVADLLGGESRPLCRTEGPEAWQKQGPFRFSPEGLAFGLEALAEALRRDVDIIFVDEVGPLELQGKGWASGLDAMVERRKPMVWVVRSSLVDEVRLRWGLARSRVWDGGLVGTEALAADILAELSSGRKTVALG